MNYYAQGGQAYGLKSIAQELQDMGRGGDTMLAHINPQEAALLKRLGGSGTINPATGLPEYGLKKAWKKTVGRVEDAVKPITKPITDAVKPILPYVQYIAPFIPGVNAAYAAAMGALGSGFAGGGGFNFKKGLMGGMTAYGLSNLYTGMQAAGGAGTAGSAGAATAPPVELGVPGTDVVASTTAQTGLQTPGAFDQVMAGDFGGATSTVGQNIGEGISSAYNSATDPNTYANMGDKFTTQISDAGQGIRNLAGLGEGTAAEAAKAFSGSGATMTNTLGAGFMGYTGQAALAEMEVQQLEADLAAATDEQERNVIMAKIQAAKSRAEQAMRDNPYQFAEGGEVPSFGLSRFLRRSLGQANAQAEETPEQINNKRIGELTNAGFRKEIVQNKTPDELNKMYESYFTKASSQPTGLGGMFSRFRGSLNNSVPSTSVPSTAVPIPEDQKAAYMTLMNNPYEFAMGGSVDDEVGSDDFNNYMGGGIAGMANINMPPSLATRIAGMAKGGTTPRFLSGGGDGMSDDIPAVISGKQPARLADGEFVIPADVVSHLGNGSSKAGAKQLYSMMDKVRSARTGNKQQGKQIKPAKFLPA